MAPARRKGSSRAAAAAASQWKVGDLVLAKMKGFPPWPATISEPEKWNLPSVKKKLLVYFYGTKQIAFCNYADIEAFTEEKKKSLLGKRHKKGRDYIRALYEIIDKHDSLKKHNNNKSLLTEDNVVQGTENKEVPCSISARGSPKQSSDIANSHKPSHDEVSPQDTSTALKQNDHFIVDSMPDDPTEKLSIVDELGQTSVSAIRISRRKRQSDAQKQNHYVQTSFLSLWSSRSSLSDEPKNSEQHSVQLNDSNLGSDDLISAEVKEDSGENNSGSDVECASDIHDNLADSVSVPSSLGWKSNQSEVFGITDDGKSISCRSMPNNSCKNEISENGHSEKEVGLNGKSNLPLKTMIFKRKRKSNQKRANCSTECSRLDESGSKVELNGSHPGLPPSRNEVNKSDGDKHLPILKRARVRMGRALGEETRVDEIVADNKNMGVENPEGTSYIHDTLANFRDCHLANGISSGIKGDSASLPKEDSSFPSGREIMLSRDKNNQQQTCTVDVEAALPPSKRLHRALEAMSANAAETTGDNSEASRLAEMVTNGCTSSSEMCSLHETADAIVASPMVPHNLRTPKALARKIFVSELTLEKKDVPASVSLDVKRNEGDSSSHDKDCKVIPVDYKCYAGSFSSSTVDSVVCDKTLQSCSNKFTEHHIEAMPSGHISSALEKAHEGGILRLKEFPNSVMDKHGDESVQLVGQKQGSVLGIKVDKCVPDDSALNGGSTRSNSSGATKSSSIQSEDDMKSSELATSPSLTSKGVNHKVYLKDKCLSPDDMPMKHLIAAAQAKRHLSRTNSFSDNFLNSKAILEASVNTSTISNEGWSLQPSPPNPTRPSSCTSDRVHNQQNGSTNTFNGFLQKGVHILAGHAEANAARKAFEAFLFTLSRTKESISRATCLAIECAKYGIAGEVVDIILENLGRESSLYKRVDLFFLVDSIAQRCRVQKGGAGEVYLSLIQAVLPRLLSVVAPPGSVAWENRRQCLKVLRLWLERKTLPEYTVRHHIRELDLMNEASYGIAASRRPSRTERALNDPLLEMEGMLDEYGSNASFQLPCLLPTNVLEDEDGSPSEENIFEAVTPERTDQQIQDDTDQASAEKHRRVLEEVDGELEMEDVAPPCSEVGTDSASQPVRTDSKSANPGQNHSLGFSPPLPDDRPPTPPPLPSSPPPLLPPCSTAYTPQPQPATQGSSDPVELLVSSTTHNLHNQQSHSISIHSNNLDSNQVPSEKVDFGNPVYVGHPQQMPTSASVSAPGSHGFSAPNPEMRPGNNVQQVGAPLMPNKAYLQPPPPPVSSQFSYVGREPQQQLQSWGTCTSYAERYHYNAHDRGNPFGNTGVRAPPGPPRHEIVDRGRYTPTIQPADKVEASPASFHYRPPPDPSPIPCPGWSIPPRIPTYPPPSRPPVGSPVSRAERAHGYWRPR